MAEHGWSEIIEGVDSIGVTWRCVKHPEAEAKLAAACKEGGDWAERFERAQQTIIELKAKLAAAETDNNRLGEAVTMQDGRATKAEDRIAELEADVNVEKLRATLAEDEVKRLTERMRMAGVVIAAIREMAAPSGVGNDPNCTCSTCAHEFGQSEIDKESCKACRQAVIDHGTHPQWKRRDKQSAPESPEGKKSVSDSGLKTGAWNGGNIANTD